MILKKKTKKKIREKREKDPKIRVKSTLPWKTKKNKIISFIPTQVTMGKKIKSWKKLIIFAFIIHYFEIILN